MSCLACPLRPIDHRRPYQEDIVPDRPGSQGHTLMFFRMNTAFTTGSMQQGSQLTMVETCGALVCPQVCGVTAGRRALYCHLTPPPAPSHAVVYITRLVFMLQVVFHENKLIGQLRLGQDQVTSSLKSHSQKKVKCAIKDQIHSSTAK